MRRFVEGAQAMLASCALRVQALGGVRSPLTQAVVAQE
jgi:hypothetical protein